MPTGEHVSERIRGRSGHSTSMSCERDTSVHTRSRECALVHAGHPARTQVAGAVVWLSESTPSSHEEKMGQLRVGSSAGPSSGSDGAAITRQGRVNASEKRAASHGGRTCSSARCRCWRRIRERHVHVRHARKQTLRAPHAAPVSDAALETARPGTARSTHPDAPARRPSLFGRAAVRVSLRAHATHSVHARLEQRGHAQGARNKGARDPRLR
jgi:hypothetical protein